MNLAAKIEGITGRTVIVTGATRNLGSTIADRFAGEGARVIVHGPTREIAEVVVFLAAGRTPSLTGTRIVIDGGVGAQFVPRDISI